jgi:hypothetical protein
MYGGDGMTTRTYCIATDTYERALFRQLSVAVPALAAFTRDSHRLARDIVMMLWQAAPEVALTEDTSDVQVVSALLASAGMQRLRTITVHDAYAAAYAAVGLQTVVAAMAQAQTPSVSVATAGRTFDKVLRDLDRQRAAAADVGVTASMLAAMTISEQVRLMHACNTPAVSALLAQVGRLDGLEPLLRRDVVAEPELALGSHLDAVSGAQLAGLVKPLRWEFLSRLADGQLEVTQPAAASPGPVVVCIDSSASMSQPYAGGTRESWAKALGLAIVKKALSRNRPVSVLLFAGTGHLKSFRMTKRDTITAGTMMSLVETSLGGGTDFASALSAAAQQVASHSTQSEADVIFVSDGQCQLRAAQLRQVAQDKAALGFTLHSVTIGDGDVPFADHTHSFDDFLPLSQNDRFTSSADRAPRVGCTRGKAAICP